MKHRRCVLWLLSAVCGYGCQSGKPVNFAAVQYTKPAPKVWVQGYVRGRSTDSSQAMLDCIVVFWRPLPDNSAERVVDYSTPKTGKYRVQLTGGYAYRIDVNYYRANCTLATEEYAISDRPTDTLQLKDFYLPYCDTTNCGSGCSRGWRHRYVKVQ